MGWLRQLFTRQRRYNELSESIREHLEEKIADLTDRGMTRQEAERTARRDFGNVTRIEERSREIWQWPTVEGIVADVRFALRQLIKSPGFTITAVLTLALGIGATTAIFTLVQQVMLQSLPVARPDQLWRIGDQPHCCDWGGYSQDSEEQLVPLYRQIQDRFNAIPGVHSVSGATYAPMSGNQNGHDIRIQGKPEPGPKDDVSADWTRITPGFFDAIGARMLAGRTINEDDNENTRHVAVINEAFAKEFFGNQNPIGQHFGPGSIRNAGTYEIVGVVQNIHSVTWGFRDPARAMYYIPEAQTVPFDQRELQSDELVSQNLWNIVIWAPEHPANMLMQVKKALAEVNPILVMYDAQPYSRVIQQTFDQQNMIASLAWLFGAVGLVLAAVGLYGVTAYGVEQRTSEIGLRMALGADRRSVVAMVLRGAFWQVSIGLGIGIPAAIGAGYLMSSQLFGVAPWNPLLLAGATLLIGLAALVAAVIPAQRAASTDPMQALRSE
jgi:putative ABC transport system permease protein